MCFVVCALPWLEWETLISTCWFQAVHWAASCQVGKTRYIPIRSGQWVTLPLKAGILWKTMGKVKGMPGFLELQLVTYYDSFLCTFLNWWANYSKENSERTTVTTELKCTLNRESFKATFSFLTALNLLLLSYWYWDETHCLWYYQFKTTWRFCFSYTIQPF